MTTTRRARIRGGPEETRVQNRLEKRINRRIPCEFELDGHVVRALVVDVSRNGMFVQTDSIPDPGEVLELWLKGSATFPAVTLRAQVVRRRATPMQLASVVRRGIGLRVLKAPDEYYDAVAAAEPGHTSDASSPDAPALAVHGDPAPSGRERRDDVEAPKESESGRRSLDLLDARNCDGRSDDASQDLELDPVGPVPPATAANARAPVRQFPGSGVDTGWTAPTPPGCPALVIDDGELDDVCELLEDLGAEPLRHQTKDAAGFRGWEHPPSLFIVAARQAMELRVPSSARASGVVSISVAAQDSHTVCSHMQRLGFSYVVRRPIHPEALRLLLMDALYRQRDLRAERRLPFGCDVTLWRGWRRQRATAVEISSSGCRLLSTTPLPPGARIRIHIPGEPSEGRHLVLRARVARCRAQRPLRTDRQFVVAAFFDAMRQRNARRLAEVLARRALGPTSLPRPPAAARTQTRESEPSEPADSTVDRRRQARAELRGEVLAMDDRGERVIHVLAGRDLSIHGIRIEPHPAVALGNRLHLALYDAAEAKPLLVEAEVIRDDGAHGLALRFTELSRVIGKRLGRMMGSLPPIEDMRAPGGTIRGLQIGELLRRRSE